MEDSITLDGKRYISSKRAAQLGGYTKDYVGQMCRSGKLTAKLLGRNWYILEDSLKSHKGNKKSRNSLLDKTSMSYTKETPSYKVSIDDRPLNPTPIKSNKATVKVLKKSDSKAYKVVTRESVEKRRLPVLRLAVVILLLLAIVATITTEGKVVYNTASDNLFAGIEFIEMDRIISDIMAIISR